MSDPLAGLRVEVATAAGLSPAAAGFLTSDTVGEIEDQADRLAKVIGARDEREREAAPVDLLTASRAQKAHRQRALVDWLTGRQARDEEGRFVGRGSFDGGARQVLPPRADPEREHSRLAGDLIAASRQARSPADAGANF